MAEKYLKRSPLKETPLHHAGQSLDEEIERITEKGILEPLFYFTGVLIIAGAFWDVYLTRVIPNPWFATLVVVIVFIIAAARIIKARKQIKLLRMARDGEKIVAENLDIVKQDGSTVFHDIIGENFNIDHVVLSRHGIYVVETKTWSKPAKGNPSITYNGKRICADGFEPDKNPLDQVAAASRWLEEIIQSSTGKKFPVRPVIVFPGWFVEPMPEDSRIWVLNPKVLSTFIKNESLKISETDLHMIAFHLSRYIRSDT